MLDEKGIKDLTAALRQEGREFYREYAPERDPVKDEELERRRYHEQGWKVAGDCMNRDQLDIIGQVLEIDPERLKSIDVFDFWLLAEHFNQIAPNDKFDEVFLGYQSWDEMIRWEALKLDTERLMSLIKKHGLVKALEINRQERESRKKQGIQSNSSSSISRTQSRRT